MIKRVPVEPAVVPRGVRVGLMVEDPDTAPDEAGALVIDETGDHKDGKAIAHGVTGAGAYELAVRIRT